MEIAKVFVYLLDQRFGAAVDFVFCSFLESALSERVVTFLLDKRRQIHAAIQLLMHVCKSAAGFHVLVTIKFAVHGVAQVRHAASANV